MTSEVSSRPRVDGNIHVGSISCAPGERAAGLIPVGTGSSGAEVGIPLVIVNGAQPGPVLAVGAGIHGDEYEGMEAIRRVVADVDPATLKGALVGLPCINTPAFDAATRVSGLDHLNLNRTFPGDSDGSYSQRLAATLLDVVLPSIDALVDLHTGGTFGEITPLAIVQRGYEELASRIGMAAGHKVIWKGGAWGGTARAETLAQGKPAVTIEAGGGTFREHNVELHVFSITNIMRELGLVDGEPELHDVYDVVTGSFTRAQHGGFLQWTAEPGERVAAGAEVARVVDHYGNLLERFVTPTDAIILWVRRLRTVKPGDEVVILGPGEDQMRP